MKILYFIIAICILLIIVLIPFIFPTLNLDRAIWVNGISSVGTIGALLFLIFEKIGKDKVEKEIFWHQHLPYLTVGSPCDPTQNRCEINLLQNNDEIGNRGAILFSIVNFSRANAFDIHISISASKEFNNDSTRSHYIDFIPVYNHPIEEYGTASGVNFIYSKFHISPTTKDVRLDEFDICNFANNCDVKKGLKTIFIKLKYFSSSNLIIRKEIISVFKIDLECGEMDGSRSVIINNIIRLDYKSSVK